MQEAVSCMFEFLTNKRCHHQWEIVSQINLFDYNVICNMCGEKKIKFIDYLDDKAEAFHKRNRERRRKERPEKESDYCHICKKLRPEWDQTENVEHVRIHLLIDIRNKPPSVVYRNCYPQWDGTDI